MAGDRRVVARPLSETQVVTRQRLLDAARDLAGDGGYEAVNMRALAERAGVSVPTAYQYFASRDHVLVELLGELAAATTDLLAARPSRRGQPVERTVATLRRIVGLAEEEPDLFVAMIRAYVSGAPEVRHARVAMQSSMRDWIDGALGDAAVEDRDTVITILESVLFTGLAGLVVGGTRPSEVGDALERSARLLLR